MSMIAYGKSYRSQVLDIWLAGNLQAHPFIPPDYWRKHREEVGDALEQATVLLWEEAGEIQGFVGVVEEGYIAGIFVAAQHRSKGIGTKLIRYCKERFPQLSLHVYEKNGAAIAFYEANGFQKQRCSADPQTGEREWTMVWHREKE